VWTIEFNDGAMDQIEYVPTLFADDLNRLDQSNVPYGLRVHMHVQSSYIRDVGWNPDFPVVGQNAIDMLDTYERSSPQTVATITMHGFVQLIEIIGPLKIDDEYISSSGISRLIEEETDSQGTGYLSLLLEGLIAAFSRDALLRNPIELATTISNILYQRDIMIYSVSPDVQNKLTSAGWSGAIGPDIDDRLIIVDSNVGWSKSDQVIDRSGVYEVWLDEEGSRGELTLNYSHNGPQTDEDCTRQSPPGEDNDYQSLINRCYWNFIRVYPSGNTRLLEHLPLPLPEGAIAAVNGYLTEGHDTFETRFDSSGKYYSALLPVVPGSSNFLRLSQIIDSADINFQDAVVTYTLHLSAQPGSSGRSMEIKVHAPEGFSTTNDNDSGTPNAEATITTFRSDLLTDQTITAIFNKN